MNLKESAFLKKLPDILKDLFIYLFAAFIAPTLNILIGFGLISNSSDKKVVFYEFLFSNEVLYGLLSTISGLSMSILFFYLTSKKDRKTLYVVLAISFIFSLTFSTIALIQTQIGNIFEYKLFNFCVYLVFISFLISSVMFNYDSEVAQREIKVQEIADKYKSTSSAKINDIDIKL